WAVKLKLQNRRKRTIQHMLIVYLFVCVLNFADERQKFESDFQKPNPFGDAPRRNICPLFRRVEATLGRSISCQPFC
ncbi:MAG: hypothetical protein WCQ16_06050, partial [Verrucomicrobiae bacterium]